MSELSQALISKDKEVLTKTPIQNQEVPEVPPMLPNVPVVSENEPAFQEGDMLTDQTPTFERTTQEDSVLGNLPENVYDEQSFQKEVTKSNEDEIYRQTLINRGHDPDKLKSANEKIREKQVLDFMIKLSEHPNGANHVENFIYNIVHEEGDFRDGGLWDGVDVTNLLNPLRTVFPDIDELESETRDQPRLVSPVADRLKGFLKERLKRDEAPVKTFLLNEASATGQTYKEILWDAPYMWGRGLIQTVAEIADVGAWMTDSPLGSKAWTKIPPIFVLQKMRESITATEEKSFKAVSNYYFPARDKPQTVLGQLALSGGEFGLAYATGRAIYQSVAAPLKAIMPRVAAMLETQAGGMAAKEVIGGTLITTPEERLATALKMMGVEGDMVNYIAGSPNDGVFEKRFKSFVDSVYTGVGLSLIAPVVMMTGKGAWHASRPAVKGSKEKAKQALAYGSSFFDRIFKNYPVEEALRLDMGAPQVIKTAELRRIQDLAKQQIEKEVGKEEAKNILAKGINYIAPGAVDETTAVKEILASQGIKMEDDVIQPMIKHPDIKSFLVPAKGAKNKKTFYADSIAKAIDSMSEGISYDRIIADQEKYFPGLFNLNNISGKNRKQAVADLGKIFAENWDNAVKSHGETIVDAATIRGDLVHMFGEEKVGLFLKDFALKSDAHPGYMLALRQYLVEETIPFRVASKNVVDAKAALAEKAITKKEYKKVLLEFYTSTYKLMDILEADVRLGGNTARTLEARKIPVGGTDKFLDNIFEAASEGGHRGEDLLFNLANVVTKYENPSQFLAGMNREKGFLHFSFEALKSIAIGGLLSSPKTLAAVPVGLSTYIATKTFENYISASLNAGAGLIYKVSGKNKNIGKYIGKGQGMTFNQANAYQFGMMQALLEVFGGTGYFQKKVGMTVKQGTEAVKRSAPSEGARVARTLDLYPNTDPGGVGDEMIKMAGPSKTVVNLGPVVGEWTMAKGLNSADLERLLGLDKDPEMRGHGAKFLAFLVNSAGFVSSFNSRVIMSQDGFFGTILERAEMHMRAMKRAEERLRGFKKTKDGYTDKQLQEEYFKVVKNYPAFDAKEGLKQRKVGLMQEQGSGLVGKAVDSAEKFKTGTVNDPLTPAGLGNSFLSLKGNLARTYVASKFSFIRTMSNIYKQTLTERGIGKIANTILKGKDRRKFINDEHFRQEVLAKVGTGTLMMTAGYGLGKQWLSDDKKEIYMEGLEASNRRNQYMKLVTGDPYGPSIKIRDLKSGDVTAIPLDRLDMAKAPMVLGAIWATREAQAHEAIVKMEEGPRKVEAFRELHELSQNYARALGDFVTDLPMAQGLKDTVTNLLPGFGNKEWDPSKEVAQFYGFLNPKHSFLSSLMGNIHKVAEGGVRYQKYSDQKTINRPLGDDDDPVSGWKKQEVETELGEMERLWSKVKGDKIFTMTHFYNLLDDVARKHSIIDTFDPANPIVGQDLHAMVGPEGGLIKYLPQKTEDKLREALEILAIPFSPKVLARSNTSDLIIGFEIPYDNPKDWSTGTQYNLSPEQKYDWAVEAGNLNKRSFRGNYWTERLLELRLGEFDKTASGQERFREIQQDIKLEIEENRELALERMASRTRNREFMEYLDNAAAQSKTAHPEDQL